MRKSMMAVTVITLVLAGSICDAEDKNNDRLVLQLMEVSGLKKQVYQIPQLLQSDIGQQQLSGNITPEESKRINGLMLSSFEENTIYKAIQEYVKANLHREDIIESLAWLESSIGKKITMLEENASTPNAYMEMQEIGPKLLEENKNTSRFAKIKKLDKVIRATEASVNIVQNVQLAILSAVSASIETGKRPSFKDIQVLVEKQKFLIQTEMEREVQIQFLYTYRELTDHEIDKYIGFAETKSGQRYHQVTIDALNQALVQGARRFGKLLGMKMTEI